MRAVVATLVALMAVVHRQQANQNDIGVLLRRPRKPRDVAKCYFDSELWQLHACS
jgi:hypothetical protein